MDDNLNAIILNERQETKFVECSVSQNFSRTEQSDPDLDCAHVRSSKIVEGWPIYVTEKSNENLDSKKSKRRKIFGKVLNPSIIWSTVGKGGGTQGQNGMF